MYTITATDNDQNKKTISVMDEEYGRWIFKQFTTCLDLRDVIMVNGLTGQVLWEFINGQYTVANGARI